VRPDRSCRIAILAVAAVGSFSSFANAAECFPKCRAGYVCSPEGKCVSECNPPCDGGLACRAGACVAEGEAPPAPAETKLVEVAWTGGVGAHVSTASAPFVHTSLSVAVGGEHAFLAGFQGGLGFFSSFIGTSTIPELGLNVGYRGYFTNRGDIRAGMFAVAQPQLWLGSDVLLGLGGALGGVLTYKRLVVEIPLSVVRVAALGTADYLRTGKEAVVFTPSVRGGIWF
jgi:hypothetical protein